MTPMTVHAVPSSTRVRPSTPGSAPKERTQARWHITATRGASGAASEASNTRPSIGLTPRKSNPFGVIHATTQGGPAQATQILVYKVYMDGFVGLNLGSSSAQSVVLMAIVIVLTVIQFRYIERRVQY